MLLLLLSGCGSEPGAAGADGESAESPAAESRAIEQNETREAPDNELVGGTSSPVCAGEPGAGCAVPGWPNLTARACNRHEQTGPMGSGGVLYDLELSTGRRSYAIAGGRLVGTVPMPGDAEPALAVLQQRFAIRPCHGGQPCVEIRGTLLVLRPTAEGRLQLLESHDTLRGGAPRSGALLARRVGELLVVQSGAEESCEVIGLNGEVVPDIACAGDDVQQPSGVCMQAGTIEFERTEATRAAGTDPLAGLEGL
ncbi:MAG: hypothetical protein AB8I08_38130 [Sandaracinaceae bacterium]